MRESYMEDLLWKYPDEFFPGRGFKQFERQYRLPSGGRFDLAFHDINETLGVIEIKAVPLKIEVVNQVHQYAIELRGLHRQGPPPISMVVAPMISQPARAQLDYWGVAYDEIHEETFRRVASAHGEIAPEPSDQPTNPPSRGIRKMTGAAGSQGGVQRDFFARLRNSCIQHHPELDCPWKETGSFLLEPEGLPGINIKWAFRYGEYRAEVQIYFQDKQTNHVIFEKLRRSTSQIEEAFGRPLRWKPDMGRGCAIVSVYDGRVTTEMLEDPVRSDELIQWGTSEMKKLKDVIIPFLKPLL